MSGMNKNFDWVEKPWTDEDDDDNYDSSQNDHEYLSRKDKIYEKYNRKPRKPVKSRSRSAPEPIPYDDHPEMANCVPCAPCPPCSKN